MAAGLQVQLLHARPFQSRSLSLPARLTSLRCTCSASTPSSKQRSYNITLLPGDGIGPEVISVAKDVLLLTGSLHGILLSLSLSHPNCQHCPQNSFFFNWVFTSLSLSFLGIKLEFQEMPLGGAALDATGVPLPDETLSVAKQSDAVLLGAIGGCFPYLTLYPSFHILGLYG